MTALPNEALLLVASDGAGSAPYAEEGSKLACSIIESEVSGFFQAGNRVEDVGQDHIDSWVTTVVAHLHDIAQERGVAARDFACTLLAAIISPTASAFFQVGDGAIVVLEGNVYRAVTWPDNGEYANVTTFVTEDHALHTMQVRLAHPPVAAVVAFTDGLQSLALQYDTREPHAPFFDPLLAHLRQEPPGPANALFSGRLEAYLTSETIASRTDDDLSLLLATNGHSPRAQEDARVDDTSRVEDTPTDTPINP